MGGRKRLGLIFSYDDRWIGGTYYIINLIRAFKVLPSIRQPMVVAFSNRDDFNRLKEETAYPFLEFQVLDERPLGKWKRALNRISFILKGPILFKRLYKGRLDGLFLLQQSGFLDAVPMQKRIYWIPDLQDKHLPQFFTEEGLRKKEARSQWIASNAHRLILSSGSVYADWKTFYPDHRCDVKVLNFAVTHSAYDHLPIDELLMKHRLPKVYFFSPNQFWAHKNHMIVLKAVEVMAKAGKEVVVAFSGKENDHRNPGYAESLKAYVNERGMASSIRFLGFLDRDEQLQLMRHSCAIIQPSLFEGWSTVIEDAMCMDKSVIASDLEVNKEQLGDSGYFFDPTDACSLADQMQLILQKQDPVVYDYDKKRQRFAEEAFSIFFNS